MSKPSWDEAFPAWDKWHEDYTGIGDALSQLPFVTSDCTGWLDLYVHEATTDETYLVSIRHHHDDVALQMIVSHPINRDPIMHAIVSHAEGIASRVNLTPAGHVSNYYLQPESPEAMVKLFTALYEYGSAVYAEEMARQDREFSTP
jgi:hypothetical protein